MIKPKEMTQVRIITPAGNIRSVIESLYELKALHIIDFKKTDRFFDIGRPLKDADFYSKQLIDVRSAMSRLGISGQAGYLKNIKDAEKKFTILNREFKATAAKLDEVRATASRLAEEANNPLASLGITRNKLREYKSLVSFIGTVKTPIEQKISAITKGYILLQSGGKRLAVALFVPRALGEKAREVLSEAGFSEGTLPESLNVDAKLSNARREINALENRLNNFSKNSQFLLDYEFALTQLNEKAEAPLRFASSKSAFVASGWLPKDAAAKLQQSLGRAAKEKVHVEFMHGDNPPTVLKNPGPVNNFEFLLNMYSLPRYYEIDPTILMFLTFPLFFGFMLGDVGYGIITLALMLLLERKIPTARPLIRIITIAALASIAFGFVFGEAFGYEFLRSPILNRVHDVNTMMLISIIIGVVHLNLGFVLGFINELKHHSTVQSFLRKGSWITLQIGAGLAFFYQHNALSAIGGIVALASVIMIIKAEGLKAVEIPAMLSNILSYLRLYAIGLASVSLAVVVNKMASGFFANGGFFIIGGVLILLLGHAVNLLLGLLGPFLQSLRLHYVEFFQKFYEGGGYSYNPFGFVKSRR